MNQPNLPKNQHNLDSSINIKPFGEFENNLQHLNIVLSADRALSPAGSRRLKDRRCLGEGAEFPWPSPAVFFFPEFCKKLLISLKRNGHIVDTPPNVISMNELLLYRVSELEKNGRVSSIPIGKLKNEIKEAIKLSLIHSDTQKWLRIAKTLEEDSRAVELSNVTQRIILFIELQLYADSKSKILSEWSYIDIAMQALNKTPSIKKEIWKDVGERHPLHNIENSSSLHVPLMQGLWPLEKSFLEACSKHCEVYCYQTPTMIATPEDFELSIPPAEISWNSKTDSTISQAEFSLAWGYKDDRPSTLESLNCIPGKFPLDALAKTKYAFNFELQLLAQFLDFQIKEKPQQHNYLKFYKFHDRIKKDMSSFDGNIHEFILNKIKELLGAEPEWAEDFLKISQAHAVDWLEHLSKESSFTENIETLEFERLSSGGLPLLTLQDLPTSGSANKFLCMHDQEIRDIFSPLSAHNLSKSLFPKNFQAILQDEGYFIPEARYDAELLLGAYLSVKDSLKIITDKIPAPPVCPGTAHFSTTKLQNYDAFSPSALESWATCSYRFYFEKLHKIQPQFGFDELPVNPMSYGNWVHKSLEELVFTPEASFEDVLVCLQNHKEEIFGENASPAYLEILSSEAYFLAERLFKHLSLFELPMSKLLGNRKISIEKPLQALKNNQKFKGRYDRLDAFESGVNFLWDYKTGNIPFKTSATLIKNNKFQWHLYKHLLEDTQAISGGGYLNPITASKSHLIIYEDDFAPEAILDIQEICNNSGHRLEVIGEKTLNKVDTALDEKLESIFLEISEGKIEARGSITKDCKNCQAMSLCGKPYLETTGEVQI